MNAATTGQPAAPAGIDVIVAAWNRADTIERAVASALAQDNLGRVIVVDDGSSDDTALRVERMAKADDRVTLIRQPRNGGPAAARNAALAVSTAPWFTILDGDDFFLPGRLAGLLKLAEGYDLIADDLLQVAEEKVDREKPRPMMSDVPFDPWDLDFVAFVLGNVSKPGAQRKELGFFKPLMRRAFLDAHHLRYDERLRLGEDFALYAAALLNGARFRVCASQGYVSVMRSGSLSGNHSRQDLERLRDCGLALRAAAQTPAQRQALAEHYRSVDCRVQWLGVIQAVKDRKPAAFAKAFLRSWTVTRFLLTRLAEQVYLRTVGNRALGEGEA